MGPNHLGEGGIQVSLALDLGTVTASRWQCPRDQVAHSRHDFGQVISPHMRTNFSRSRHPGHPRGPEPGQGENKERGVYAFKAVIAHSWSPPASYPTPGPGQLPRCVDWKAQCYKKCLLENRGQGVKSLVFQSNGVICTVSLIIKGGFD